ncbi:MAG: hypothetical protein M3N19_09225, partial [Candidatus Eremiobacteraeota bacterium]|nr:hypothetical protein [Candidatus Eremiobacteraeota bacterium]
AKIVCKSFSDYAYRLVLSLLVLLGRSLSIWSTSDFGTDARSATTFLRFSKGINGFRSFFISP